MDITSLKYFLAVAECLSFTKAADLLYVTQPTLSRQISALEGEMGLQLLNRTNKTTSLTPAGKVVYLETKQVVLSYERLLHTLDQLREGVVGKLNIGYCGNLGFETLSNLVAIMHRKYPSIEINVVQDELPTLGRLLEINEIDVVFTLKADTKDLTNISWRKVYTNTLQCIVPSDHPLAQLSKITLDDLKNEKFIFPPREIAPSVVDWLISTFRTKKMIPNIVAYGRGAQNMMLLVLAGRGVALMTSHMKITAVPGISFLDIEECSNLFDVILAWKNDNENPVIQLLLREIEPEIPTV